MTQKETIAKLVKLFMEQQSIDEQVKEITDEAKEAGYNAVVLKSVAKAVVAGKVDELNEKAEATQEAIAIARS